MAGDLSGVRQKLNRAKSHLKTLVAEANKAEHPDFYRMDVQPDTEAGYYVVKIVSRGSTEEWPLILGDILYNLRSALDHIVWQLVIANGKKPGKLNQFPIAKDEAWFDSNVSRYLARVHGDAVEAIRALQPFHVRDKGKRLLHPLWLLSELENIDKHRLVHVFAFLANEASLHFDERFPFTEDDVEFFPLIDGRIEDGAKIARVRSKRQPKMEMDSRLTLSIEIEATEDTPRLEWGVIDAMINAVDDVMRALTPFVVWSPK